MDRTEKALLKEITNKLNENRDSRVSEHTIKLELHKEGYFCLVVKKPVVVWDKYQIYFQIQLWYIINK
jgi:hypothetical protein